MVPFSSSSNPMWPNTCLSVRLCTEIKRSPASSYRSLINPTIFVTPSQDKFFRSSTVQFEGYCICTPYIRSQYVRNWVLVVFSCKANIHPILKNDNEVSNNNTVMKLQYLRTNALSFFDTKCIKIKNDFKEQSSKYFIQLNGDRYRPLFRYGYLVPANGIKNFSHALGLFQFLVNFIVLNFLVYSKEIV
jgi:hypothetical protein